MDNEFLAETVEEYNDRYNKKALLLPEFYGEKTGSNKKEEKKAEERMAQEIAQIKLSLQNEIDRYLLWEIYRMSSRDKMAKITERLHQPEFEYLSRPIFLFIADLLKSNTTENTCELLGAYAKSTYDLLLRNDNMYGWHGLKSYVMAVINGETDIDDCYDEIYEEVFVRNQLEKCDFLLKTERIIVS